MSENSHRKKIIHQYPDTVPNISSIHSKFDLLDTDLAHETESKAVCDKRDLYGSFLQDTENIMGSSGIVFCRPDFIYFTILTTFKNIKKEEVRYACKS